MKINQHHEKQIYRSTRPRPNLQKMLATLQDLGGADKHGNVGIMPASVHFAGNFAFVLPFNSFLQPLLN